MTSRASASGGCDSQEREGHNRRKPATQSCGAKAKVDTTRHASRATEPRMEIVKMQRNIYRMLTLALALGTIACGDPTVGLSTTADFETQGVPGNTVASAVVYPRLSVSVGSTIDLASQSKRGTRTVGSATVYRSIDTAVASLSGSKVTGRSDGATIVTASRSGGIIDTTVLLVGRGPGTLRFASDTIRLAAVGDSGALGLLDTQYNPTLTSENAAIARTTATGKVVAVAVGTTRVTATNVVGATGSVAVVVAIRLPIRFASDSLIVTVGDSAPAVTLDASSPVSFGSTAPAIAQVSAAGMVRGISVGQTTIQASSTTNVSASLRVIVKAASTAPQGRTINMLVRRRDTGTGVVMINNAVPLPQGSVQPGALSSLRVIVAGVEQRIYVEALRGRHADGSLRSVLIQFPYSLDAAGTASAQLVISSTPRSVGDLTEQSTARGNPQAVILPTDPSYLVTTDLVGPTLTFGEAALRFGAIGKQYDDDFVRFADYQLAQNGEGWGENYYDRAQIYYAMWVRSGNPVYWDRGTRQLLNWRSGYLEAVNYGTSPHQSQVDGLGLHYLLTGDQASRYAIDRINGTLWYFRVRVGLGTKTSGDIENRIRARVLMAYLWMWRLSDTPAALAPDMETAISAVLNSQETDGSYRFTAYCNQSLNYMDGMLNEALIQSYTYFRADPRIVTAVKNSTDWLWGQWMPLAQGFKYVPLPCTLTGTSDPVPELNNLIVNGYSWIYAMTGNAVAATRADEVFTGGVQKSFLQGTKQFNQQYTTGWRYFALRDGRL